MSEQNEVKNLCNTLVSKYYFSKSKVKINPSWKSSKDVPSKKIREILRKASINFKKIPKENNKSGKPDVLYENPETKFLLIIEAKKNVFDHELAIDDIHKRLNFFREFSQAEEYKIVGLAFSGDIETEDHEITSFVIKEKEVIKKQDKDQLWTEGRYLSWFRKDIDNKQEEDLEKIKQIANKVSELLRILDDSSQKATLVAGALISLYKPEGKPEKKESIRKKIQNKIIKNFRYQKQLKEYNETLNDDEIVSLSDDIIDNFSKEKSDLEIVLKEELPLLAYTNEERTQWEEKISIVIKIVKEAISKNELKSKSILANVFLRIYQVHDLVISRGYGDIPAIFYQTFMKYWRGNSEKGIVLTPWHITDLMVELIDKFKDGGITKNDICLDPCAGTGTFLLAFMTRQITKYPHNAEQIKKNLSGIEISSGMYVLSLASMLISGDGKANLKRGDCFELPKFTQWDHSKKEEKVIEHNIGLMNPPYSQEKTTPGGRAEIEFVENLLSLINGYAAVIVPIHTFNNKKRKTNKEGKLTKKFKEIIYQGNTLKAVVNMPPELFHPIAFQTCIAIFQTGREHQITDKVYFYNLENDGFKVVDGIRQDCFGKWKGIKSKLLSDVEKRQETQDKSFYIDNITIDEEWTFGFQWKKLQTKKDFEILYSKEGERYFEKTIADYLLYKIEEKTGVLEQKLKINEAEKKGNKEEKKKLEEEKGKSLEWIVINQYLLYKWKENRSNLELKSSDGISENLRFLKRLVFSDLGLEEKEINLSETNSWKNKMLSKQNELNQLNKQIKDSPTDIFLKEKVRQLENEIKQELDLTKKKRALFRIKHEDDNKDIFHLTKEEEVYIQDDFQSNGIKWGKHNYITTTEFNNGVFRKVNKSTNEGKVITIATNAECLNFYQNEPFLTNSDVAILNIKGCQMDVYIGLFLNTVLSINSKYHDWNYKRGIARIEKEWVMLPINDQGEPDWEFMRIYIYIYIAREWLKKRESKNILPILVKKKFPTFNIIRKTF